jgi:putative peptidoglycan binding protein
VPTPSDQGQPPQDRPVLEPVRVLRPRRTDALAELMKDMPRGYESVPVPPPGPQPSYPAEDDTRELPLVPPAPGGRRPGSGARRAAIAAGVAVAALTGFGCALLLPARSDATTSRPSHPAASAPAGTAGRDGGTGPGGTDPDGPGTLRRGDSGPGVAELQQRLLRVPDVYRDGSTGGRYDAALTEAVARFQLWYGVRGDETGVYGDDTRRALESRTVLGG